MVRVYLKSGSRIVGEINEWKVGEYLDLKTHWSESVILQADQIEKLTQIEENSDEIDHYISKKAKTRLLGFNMTEMVTQFMPFSQRIDQAGPYQFKFMGGGNGHLFNMQIGAGTIEGDRQDIFFGGGDSYVNMVFGYARLKNVSEKFYHYFSQNMMLSSGFLNQPDEEIFSFEDGFVAFNGAWGVGYKLTPRVSLCTEIQFIFAIDGILGDGDGRFQFVPPIGLFLVTHLK